MNTTDRNNPTTTANGDGVRRATGRDRSEWFALLDEWGAAGREYREIAAWLREVQGLSNWWAQKLIVEYEQARGIRKPGVRRDGTFEVGATKVIAASVDAAMNAFVDAPTRARWLPGVAVDAETADAGSIRFGWIDRASRVTVTITPARADKSQVVVQHTRIADAETAAALKTFWRERLTALKELMSAD